MWWKTSLKFEYIKSQCIPKSKKLKTLYAILWILEPGLMAAILSYNLVRNRNK